MNEPVELTRRLAQIARDNELAEIEYAHGETKIRLVLELEMPLQMAAPPLPLGYPKPMPVPPIAPVPAAPEPVPDPGEAIRSPLAGVFYRAPRPGAPPFVEVGKPVGTGDTLCIVEAMKLMNELTAERACKILQILVNNGEAVEQGQALFFIEPLD